VDSKKLYIMPDKDTDPSIGTKCLVLDYSNPTLSVNEHLGSKFVQRTKIAEPLQAFETKLNQKVMKLKQT